MKKKVTLKRLFHRGKWRLIFVFDYDPKILAIIKSIEGRMYSSTNRCWYVNDDEPTLKQVLKIFRDHAEVDISAIVSRNKTSGSVDNGESHDVQHENLNIESGPLAVNKENNKTDLVSDGKTVITVVDLPRRSSVEFRINEKDGRLAIRFTGHYEKEWIDEIKDYGKWYYDKSRHEWLLPWSLLTVDSLSDYFSSKGINVRVIKSVVSDELKILRKDTGDKIRARKLSEKAYEGLELLRRYLNEVRYSNKTNESYLALLELFFKYYNEKDPADITQQEVSAFIHDYVIRLGFSAAYQNQIISAIKSYYEIAGKGRIEPKILERPKRSRSLPKVFSKDEVKKILDATKNNKHKLVLWLIYSCGLRRLRFLISGLLILTGVEIFCI